ncbi:MAG TPA: acetylxylan esterase, partial [Gemmataceae bacterium]|nr:acetylxylan esterase [Gemmataceae bacterium]
MPDSVLPQPQPQAFNNLMRAQARILHAKDQPPPNRQAWLTRRRELLQRIHAAMGPFPLKPGPLYPRILHVLRRTGYRIENLIFESQPDVWVTASLYVPQPVRGRHPAVLVVHGHWPWARRDPVVQARCLGLVRPGFVVLAIDAFGAGERYTTPGRGTYHGALYGSTLWPVGQTLLGLQVYDNRRAVDYLCSRPEVDPARLGITGASGGGNQSMYAGALDDRFGAVVPVCSVGTYQAYLQAACCVCEVLPGALRFCEEGDVLALTAPRALMVINATRDAFQFSVGQAALNIARARPIFELYQAGGKLRHVTFEYGHAYNQAMREAMYGWMTRWLKNEGDGKPIAEPKHQVETPEDLACFPDEARPPEYLLPPNFAARTARRLLATTIIPDHVEDWESTVVEKRTQLRREIFGDFPPAPKPAAKLGKPTAAGNVRTTPVILHPEPDMPVPAFLRSRTGNKGPQPACVLLHLEGKNQALAHPLVDALLARNMVVLAPDLRATGETRPANDAIAGAPDHNSAEHALWLGRPLLGQWVFDVRCLLDWLAFRPGLDRRKFSVVGIGHAGIVALCAGALLDDQVNLSAAIASPVTYVTNNPYPAGTPMGILAPGILGVGDMPQLAALSAPRSVMVAQGISPLGKPLAEKALQAAFSFTRAIYRLHKAENRFRLTPTTDAKELAAW